MNPKPISNRKLTRLRKLNQKKYREREQLFLVEGGRAVRQIVENGKIEVNELFFDETKSMWQHGFWKEKIDRISASLLRKTAFTEVSDTDSPQGVLAICKMPAQADVELLARQEGIILAADRIRNPGNMGTMMRTAAWFGIKGIIAGKGTVDLFHPKVVRSTAGSTGTAPFQKADLNKILPLFEDMDWQVALLDASDKSEDIRTFTKTTRTIIVVGNEANGIDEKLFKTGRPSVHIASNTDKSYIESLNAAVAISVAMYELS